MGPRIEKAARHFPAVFMGGARQVGKTSLLKRMSPEGSYIALDLPHDAGRAENEPEAFLRGLTEPAIIDEIQYAPGLFRYLKAAIDADRRPGRFLLSASQSFSGMRAVSDSLAGRCAVLHLHSLSGRELLDAGLVDRPGLDRGIVRGGYPDLWRDADLEPDLWMSSYVATYLERDVRNLLGVQSLRDFDRFMRALGARAGGLLSYSDLARDVGISVPTAREWLSVLHATAQVFTVEPYFRNLNKRLVKSPKVFFMDTGLLCFLTGISSAEALHASPVGGGVWETWVAGQIQRQLEERGWTKSLWFWRTSSGNEVDFIIDRGGRFHLIEAKATEVAQPRTPKGFDDFARTYGDDAVLSRTVVCRTPVDTVTPGGVRWVNGLDFTLPD